jgi:hypothetical protein
VIQTKAEVNTSQHSETTTAYTWFDAVARTSAPVFVAGDAAGAGVATGSRAGAT